MSIRFCPVNADRWTDLEALFENRGGPHNCWCMAWRKNEFEKTIPGKGGKKASMKRRVDEGTPIGLLGYLDDVPVAWCSIAPKETYRPLGGDKQDGKTWSLVCFFVKRSYRNMGLTSALIEAAADYARNHDADWLEAYPVERDSPSYRFMGFRPTFEKAGFDIICPAGSRRSVMRRSLS